VLPSGIDITVATGETVFEAASRQGVDWPTRCYGQAQCMLCALELEDVADGAVAPQGEEVDAIRRIQSLRGPGFRCRLACRMRVSGAVTVRKDGVQYSAATQPQTGANNRA
jgi:ferredoxin